MGLLVDDDTFLHMETDPRYRGAVIPSRAFRMLQNMTDTGQGNYESEQLLLFVHLIIHTIILLLINIILFHHFSNTPYNERTFIFTYCLQLPIPLMRITVQPVIRL